MTRRGFVAGLSAATIMDWTKNACGCESAAVERPFGAGSSVLSPRIRMLLDRLRDPDVFPPPVAVAYDPVDMSLPEPVRVSRVGRTPLSLPGMAKALPSAG